MSLTILLHVVIFIPSNSWVSHYKIIFHSVTKKFHSRNEFFQSSINARKMNGRNTLHRKSFQLFSRETITTMQFFFVISIILLCFNKASFMLRFHKAWNFFFLYKSSTFIIIKFQMLFSKLDLLTFWLHCGEAKLCLRS